MDLISKKDSFFPEMPSFFDNFFSDDFFKRVNTGTTIPAVNIHEANGGYEIEMAIPGFKKDDFNIDLENDILSVSAKTESKSEKKDKKTTRKEFSYSSFKRSFTVPSNVNRDQIKATYTDGILKIDLEKLNDTTSSSSKQIEIS